MKKLLILGAALLVSPFAYAAEEETTHDVKVELRDLGKGLDGKQIIHFKALNFAHAKAAHDHNKHAETFLKPDADAAKHDAKVAKAKPSVHNIRLKIKKDAEGKQSISSEVVGHEDPKHDNNELAATLFSFPSSLGVPYGPETGIAAHLQAMKNKQPIQKEQSGLIHLSAMDLVAN